MNDLPAPPWRSSKPLRLLGALIALTLCGSPSALWAEDNTIQDSWVLKSSLSIGSDHAVFIPSDPSMTSVERGLFVDRPLKGSGRLRLPSGGEATLVNEATGETLSALGPSCLILQGGRWSQCASGKGRYEHHDTGARTTQIGLPPLVADAEGTAFEYAYDEVGNAFVRVTEGEVLVAFGPAGEPVRLRAGEGALHQVGGGSPLVIFEGQEAINKLASVERSAGQRASDMDVQARRQLNALLISGTLAQATEAALRLARNYPSSPSAPSGLYQAWLRAQTEGDLEAAAALATALTTLDAAGPWAALVQSNPGDGVTAPSGAPRDDAIDTP